MSTQNKDLHGGSDHKAPKRNLISLFAGAGGLDLGLEMAGFNTICANEIEPYACESLRRNKVLSNLKEQEVEWFITEALEQRCFERIKESDGSALFNRLRGSDKQPFLQDAEIIEGDIRQIPSSFFSKIIGSKELFAIAGGPPCQPFSRAGKQKSLDCTKNGDLFFEFVRLVGDLRPKWFVFENVKGITFTKTDVLYLVCKSCGHVDIAPFRVRQDWKSETGNKCTCDQCGSEDLNWQVKNEPGGSLKIILKEFERVGYVCHFNVLNAADFGAPQIRERLFIVGSVNGKGFKWPNPTHAKFKNQNGSPTLFEIGASKRPWVTMFEAIWENGHTKFGMLDKKKSVLWVKNVVRPHDEPVTWSLDRPSPTIGAHQGAKLALAPEGVPEEQLFRQQWHSKGRRQGDTPPVPVVHEYLTDEELLTLQTFPKWWYLHGTRMQRAFQIGNAVPPILAYHVGKAILKAEFTNDYEYTSGLYKR